MKKKFFFSITLWIALLLPQANLIAESQPWREWFTQGLVNAAQSAYAYAAPSLHHLTSWTTSLINNIDREKWTWYGALATIGIGGYTALSYRKVRLQAEKERQQKEQEKIAFEQYGMLPMSTSKAITNDEYFNIGTFLYNTSNDIPEKSHYRFNHYVLPILKKSTPQRPETLINYEKFGNQDQQNKPMPEAIRKNPDVQKYYQEIGQLWYGLIQMATLKLKQREPSKQLRKPEVEYLQTIQSYLQDNDPIKQSIADALKNSN